MFTGIIQSTGIVKNLTKNGKVLLLEIETIPSILKNKKVGDSIAVDGVCVSITDFSKGRFSAEIMSETQNKTIIKNYKKGDTVNLENPLKIGDTLDGHFVQGHVDFVGSVIKVGEEIEIRIPEEMNKFFALKGSVTINGVSLTISDLSNSSFTVSLIPTTLQKTNLDVLKKGDNVNIEVDILSRYLESLLNQKEKEISRDFLKERGFI
jgi:riboflavin synthase